MNYIYAKNLIYCFLLSTDKHKFLLTIFVTKLKFMQFLYHAYIKPSANVFLYIYRVIKLKYNKQNFLIAF